LRIDLLHNLLIVLYFITETVLLVYQQLFSRGLALAVLSKKSGVTDSPIDKHMLQGEAILSSIEAPTRARSKATFYATSKRLLRLEERRFRRERVDSLSYTQITSAGLESKRYIAEGIIIIILGFTLVGMIVGGYFQMYFGDIGFVVYLLLILILGIGVCFIKRTWYQIRAPGLSKRDLERWGFKSKGPEIQKFVSLVKDQLTK